MRKVWLLLLLICGTPGVRAQQADVAPTPPMGWNSWDSYGLTVTEGQFRANVEVLRDKLEPFGWQYAVVDEGWFFANPQDRPTPGKLVYAIDRYGRYVPVPERFPGAGQASRTQPAQAGGRAFQQHAVSVETSFAALGAWVHAQGLKFGIHIVRGIPRASVERNLPIEGSSFHAQDAADTSDVCPWDPTNWGVKDDAAGQAWYDSLLRQYAGWGVDLLKVDCISDHPYKVTEIRMIRRAIDKAGRPMVLSLSPGPTQLGHAQEVTELANMWRISDDVWDRWQRAPGQTGEFPQNVTDQFARLKAWEPFAQPNHWPDADMLPIGQLRPAPGDGQPRASRLSLEEQRTMMTLWAIARSPLILGANLTNLDPATLKLITNADVLRINQTATHSAEVLHDGDLVVWRADLPAPPPGSLSNPDLPPGAATAPQAAKTLPGQTVAPETPHVVSGEKAIALFNLGDTEMNLTRQLSEFGADFGGRDWAVRNVWGGGVPITGHEFVERIPPHGCVLLMID